MTMIYFHIFSTTSEKKIPTPNESEIIHPRPRLRRPRTAPPQAVASGVLVISTDRLVLRGIPYGSMYEMFTVYLYVYNLPWI